MSTTTLWISPADWATGEDTLRIRHLSTHFAAEITSTSSGTSKKWVHMGLRIPPGARIIAVRICYKLSHSRSYISEVRLIETKIPDQVNVLHNDSTGLKSTLSECYFSEVGTYNPKGAVTLALRLNVANTLDKILLGSVGVDIETTVAVAVADVTCFGAIGDGSSHPLRERYASLEEAQAVYPHAGNLDDDQIDWAAIQSALDSGRDVYVPRTSGYYMCKNLYLRTSNQRIFGNGHLKFGCRNGHLAFYNGNYKEWNGSFKDDVTIEGITISGTGTTSDPWGMLYLVGINNLLVSGVTVKDCGLIGSIPQTCGILVIGCKNVRVHGCYVSNVSGTGIITVNNVGRVVVSNNNIDTTGDDGINAANWFRDKEGKTDGEPKFPFEWMEDCTVVVQGNAIYRSGQCSGAGIKVNTSDSPVKNSAVIEGNTITEANRQGIYLSDSDKSPNLEVSDSVVNVSNNLIYTVGLDEESSLANRTGICIESIFKSVTISNNEIHNSGGYGIYFQQKGDLQIEAAVVQGNIVDKTGGTGIRVLWCDRSVIDSNIVQHAGCHGYWLGNRHMTITGNKGYASGKTGMALYSAGAGMLAVEIVNNTMDKSEEYGFLLKTADDEVSTGILFAGNHEKDSRAGSLYFGHTSSNTLRKCSITLKAQLPPLRRPALSIVAPMVGTSYGAIAED